MNVVGEIVEMSEAGLRSEINSLEHSIRKLEDSCASLVRFKKSVYSGQSNFILANDRRKLILQDLENPSKNNTVVGKYKKGMGYSLTGIGMKVVDAAFIGLHLSIDLKIAEYGTKIALLETEKISRQVELGALELVDGD